MTTRSGKIIQFSAPDPADIDIKDIAHALSMLCRFSGNCIKFYSVAQHSVLVSEYLEDETGDLGWAMWGLLHDAPEAYLGDLISPLKYEMPGYLKVEDIFMEAIKEAFNLSSEPPQILRKVDQILLKTESRDLLTNTKLAQTVDYPPLKKVISPLTQVQAKKAFLKRYRELKRRIKNEG